MLCQSSSSPHLKRGIHDTIQKHKIRNLRAKLKNLLSNDSCAKLSKRQKQIKNIQQLQNQQFHHSLCLINQQKHLLTHSKQQPKHYWYSEKEKCNVMNVFGKLTKQEIEQIQQDLIYYLGQENIAKFKEFLEIKENTKQKKVNNKENHNALHTMRLKTLKEQIGEEENEKGMWDKNDMEISKQLQQPQKTPQFKKFCSVNDNFMCRKSMQTNPSHMDLSNTQTGKIAKTNNLYESRTSSMTKRSTQKQRQRFQVHYLGNRQLFMTKRKIIEQEENAQRMLNKASLELKQQRAVDMLRVTQGAFVTTIREKNMQNDEKTKRILQEKYKKNITFGSIVELNEQLRKIYIKKISQIPKLSQIPERLSIADNPKNDTTSSWFLKRQ